MSRRVSRSLSHHRRSGRCGHSISKQCRSWSRYWCRISHGPNRSWLLCRYRISGWYHNGNVRHRLPGRRCNVGWRRSLTDAITNRYRLRVRLRPEFHCRRYRISIVHRSHFWNWYILRLSVRIPVFPGHSSGCRNWGRERKYWNWHSGLPWFRPVVAGLS